MTYVFLCYAVRIISTSRNIGQYKVLIHTRKRLIVSLAVFRAWQNACTILKAMIAF